MYMQKRRTRGAPWGLLVAGPLLLPGAIALSPLLLIPLGLWVFLRGQRSWEQRRLALQKRNDQRSFVFVDGQRSNIQGALLMNGGNSLDHALSPQILNIQGEIIMLVFPSGEVAWAKEHLLNTLANSSLQRSKPTMIVLSR